MKLEFTGKVSEQGVLTVVNRKDFDNCIAASFAGKEITITIDKKSRKRSSPQNRYYWSCVVPIVRNAFRELGHRVDSIEVHEELKRKFLPGQDVVNEDAVLLLTFGRTTTNLTPTGFNDYIADIRQWSAEMLNVQIPEPNEQLTVEI
jgi:hypothetical protein